MPKEQLIRYEENISMCISEEDELLDEELKYKEYSKSAEKSALFACYCIRNLI